MKGIRYEFGGVGIFHALDIIEGMEMSKSDEDDYKYAIKEFEECLEIPDILDDGKVKAISYFTEAGIEAFKDALDIILNLFYEAEEAGLGEVKEIKKNFAENIVYKDEYQFLVKQ